MTDISIWWIRRDIRLQDNHALISAVENSDQLIPLFILEPQLMVDAAPKRRAFLLQALSDLDQQLQMLGTRLILRQGPARSAFEKLAGEFEICRVFAHEDYSPFSRQRDQAIARRFSKMTATRMLFSRPTKINGTASPCQTQPIACQIPKSFHRSQRISPPMGCQTSFQQEISRRRQMKLKPV